MTIVAQTPSVAISEIAVLPLLLTFRFCRSAARPPHRSPNDETVFFTFSYPFFSVVRVKIHIRHKTWASWKRERAKRGESREEKASEGKKRTNKSVYNFFFSKVVNTNPEIGWPRVEENVCVILVYAVYCTGYVCVQNTTDFRLSRAAKLIFSTAPTFTHFFSLFFRIFGYWVTNITYMLGAAHTDSVL